MGQCLQRALSMSGLSPGQYHAMSDGAIVVCCWSCGGVDVLDDEYKISPAGVVVSFWECPTETCGERLWLTLESWLP